MAKNLARKFAKEKDNTDFYMPIIEYIKEKNNKNDDNDSYYVAFRTQAERISIYYKGREAISLYPKKYDKWMIRPREKSTSKKTDIVKINKQYEKQLKEVYDKLQKITDKYQ